MTVDSRLERYGLWSVFHKHLIVELFTTLRDGLGPEYWVDLESEILLVPRPAGPARAAAADVDVTRLGPTRSPVVPNSAAVTPALLEVDEPIGELEQTWIEIRRRDWPDREDRLGCRLVGVVELLSPANKGAFGERDLRKFLAKRRDYLLSPVSYTEFDLLAGGQRELPPAVEQLGQHTLIAWSTQARERARHFWAWGWESNDPLPTIVLPLDFPHSYGVDLADCYGRAYRTNRWSDRLQLAEHQQQP